MFASVSDWPLAMSSPGLSRVEGGPRGPTIDRSSRYAGLGSPSSRTVEASVHSSPRAQQGGPLPVMGRKEEKAIVSPEAAYAACPRDWIGFGSKCFYFSEHTSNWTFSQTSCMQLGAHLTHFDSLEELNFLHRYMGESATWIGLHRESSEHPWMWTDNTEYNNLVPIRGDGQHAYLTDRGISSGRKYIRRRWICSKPYSYTLQCPGVSQLV
uniref:C-type lectin domain family 2 member E-like isoform X3 n=1 Tax=Myodes glareolus TaxID=447135 RepID=UPI002020A0E1|nr:C-type lectin domain family 2 member E-like isoform X3 [Myodes glareolus]